MYLIVGLGNPGLKYERTKHNIGFMFIDKLAEDLDVKVNKSKFDAFVCQTTISGEKCIIMKPQTFMNNSGQAVGKAANFYKIKPENVIVVFDDISLEPGNMRIRRKGSAGGHNGIKSIIECLGSDNFKRVKVGIGAKPSPDYNLADYVLSKVNDKEQKEIDKALGNAVSAVKLIVNNEIDKSMNLYNS